MKFINKKLFLDLMDYCIMTNTGSEKQYHVEMKQFIETSPSNDSIRLFLRDRMKRDLGVDYK